MASKKTAGRLKVALSVILLFGPAFLLIFISTRSCTHEFKRLDDYGEMVNYSFTDVEGKKRTSKDFKGNIVLATTLQVTCPNNCAISLVNLNLQIFQLAKNIDNKEMKIISFVTDEKGSPVEDLTHVEAMIKDRIQDYDPEIWILASGDPKQLFDIEHEGRSLLDEKGDQYFAGEYYLEMMLLIDKSNHLRMIRSGKIEKMIRDMKQHISLLQKQYDLEANGKSNKK